MSYFEINRMGLVAELDKQTPLMGKYSMLLAEAKKLVGEMESNLELIESQLMLAMRRNPEEFDLPASNVDTIKAAVVSSERYQKAKKKLIDAKYRQDLLQGHVNTVNQRKNVIEMMIETNKMEWWSMPRMPDESKDDLQEHRRMKHAKGRKRD